MLVAEVSEFASRPAAERVELLVELVKLARSESRPGDAVGRTGEAEVSMIVSEAPVDDALVIGQRIEARAVSYDLRTGVAGYPQDAADATGLLEAARSRLGASGEPRL